MFLKRKIMPKRIFVLFFALVVCLLTFSSCSNLEDDSDSNSNLAYLISSSSSSLRFSFSGSQILRLAATSSDSAADSESAAYTLKIAISGDYTAEKELEISDTAETQTISFEDLTAGWTLAVEVSIYEGVILRYTNSDSITLKSGENTLNLALSKYVSTPSVWLYKSTADANNAALNQTLSYNSSSTSTLSENVSITLPYAFDENGNLWTADYSSASFTLTKYSLSSSTGLYSASGNSYTISGISSTPTDICYDVSKDYIYILAANTSSTESTVYAVDISAPSELKSSLTLSNSATVSSQSVTINPSQIAVYGNTVYIAGSASLSYGSITINSYGQIFKISFTDDGTSATSYTPEHLTTLCTDSVLDGYDSTNETNIEISDLQIGDGLGNDTTTLYALVRSCTSSFTALENFIIYSRGAFVSIDTSASSPTPVVYGWTNFSQTASSSNPVYSGTFYSPSSTTGTDLFGPSHFAAIVPKKLVFVDDGISYESGGTFNNQDSLVEFDIANASLSKGTGVSATIPYASGFTVN